VLLLHGWGGCIASMSPIRDMLTDEHQVVSIDLPGFGRSAAPTTTWGTEDYAECVWRLLAQIGCETIACVVGHSFGGKVAIRLALRRPGDVRSLVLVGTPGVRMPLSRKTRLRIATVKAARRASRLLPAPVRDALNERASRLGSEDYRNAGEMRPILVRTVNEDLRAELPSIGAETLLIWGEHDDAVPVAVGREMESLIPGAGLAVLPRAGHFPYIDEPRAFAAVLDSFVSSIRRGGAE
jgi:pimeloyl-ACP methyl ester carboxylesterase